MSPLQHIIITIIAFFLLSLAVPLPLSVLSWSLVLTLGIDVFDHSYLFLTVKNPTYNRSRELIRQGKLLEAYRFYYANRDLSNYSLFHHVWGTIATWIITVYFASPIILLGLVLHFSCDITALMRNRKLIMWFRHGEYSDIVSKSTKGRWATN